MPFHRLMPRLVAVTVLAGTVAVVSSTPSARQESRAAQPAVQTPAQAPIIGRWDLTGTGPEGSVSVLARGDAFRKPHARRPFRGRWRQCAPNLTGGVQQRIPAFRDPAAVGEGDVRPRRGRHAHRWCARRHARHARRRAAPLHGPPRSVAASKRRARVGEAGCPLQREGPDGLDDVRRDEPVDGGRRRPEEREVGRQHRDDRDVHRLHAARRGELPEGQQQRHLPARPLRTAGRGQHRARAAAGGHGRHLRLPRSQRRREQGPRHLADGRCHARRPPRHRGLQRQDDHR